MKKNELRIGNYVEVGLNRNFMPIISTVEQIAQTVIWIKEPKAPTLRLMPLDTIKPIPLTEDWLLKFGFVKSKENEWYHLLDFQIEIVVDENNEFVFCVVEGIVLKHIKYVHQLQNLHYCLKQTELAVA